MPSSQDGRSLIRKARLNRIVQATSFVGGTMGEWTVIRLSPVVGEPLPTVAKVAVVDEAAEGRTGTWTLRGVPSYERYTRRREHDALARVEPRLGRAEATRAALIPVRKSADWWSMSQDERRAIFEERSHHIRRGSEVLPAVARRLYQCRDLGEPFDFLTWFEYASVDVVAFDDLVAALRGTEEWSYVDREVDIRLERRRARP